MGLSCFLLWQSLAEMVTKYSKWELFRVDLHNTVNVGAWKLEHNCKLPCCKSFISVIWTTCCWNVGIVWTYGKLTAWMLCSRRLSLGISFVKLDLSSQDAVSHLPSTPAGSRGSAFDWQVANIKLSKVLRELDYIFMRELISGEMFPPGCLAEFLLAIFFLLVHSSRAWHRDHQVL